MHAAREPRGYGAVSVSECATCVRVVCMSHVEYIEHAREGDPDPSEVGRTALANQEMIDSLRAIEIASVRLCALSLRLILRKCVLTVVTDTNSFSAIA